MDAATLVSLTTVAMSLVLALRAYRAHGLSLRNTAWMTAAWLAIIAVVTLIADAVAK